LHAPHDRLLPRRQQSVHDVAQLLRAGDFAGAANALWRKGNAGSIHAVAEGLPWLMRF
jgi:hypothetical protein